MNIDSIQRQAGELASAAANLACKISNIAVTYLGHAYEWLRVTIPAAMEQASILAQKVGTTSKPYLLSLGDWASLNRNMIGVGITCTVIGAALASIINSRGNREHRV